tara:strand:+ start:887 stop:1039 length:153 start_codon:yes stop_codon:yes gene_type:complete
LVALIEIMPIDKASFSLDRFDPVALKIITAVNIVHILNREKIMGKTDGFD